MKDYVIGFGDNKVDYYSNRNIKYPGGNAANFSIAGRKCGTDAYYVGCVPLDEDGDLVYNALRSEGVNLQYAQRIPGISEKVFVEIKHGDRVFVGSEPNARETPELTRELIKLMQSSLIVHSGCHARTEQKLTELKAANVKISFDFSDLEKYRTPEYLKLVCPSIFIAQFSVADDSEKEIENLTSICAGCGVKYILFTRGSKSPIFVDVDNQKEYQGFIRKVENPHDTMGAGDTYFATFAITLMQNLKVSKITPDLIIDCFQKAADAAFETVSIDGAFGHGKKIE